MKFLRRLAHVVSIVMLTSGVGCAEAASQNTPKQGDHVSQVNPASNQPDNQSRTGAASGQATAPSGQQSGSPANDDVAIQREMAASAKRTADDTKRIADYTFWLVVVGGIVGGLQIWLSFGQSKATEKAAKSAEEATKKTERAYVVPVQWIVENIGVDQKPEIAFILRNDGSTPATLLTTTINAFFDPVLPPVPEYGPAIHEENGYRLNPNATFRKLINKLPIITAAQHANLLAGVTKLWIYGKVTYADVFNAEHVAAFCVVYDPTTRLLLADNAPGYHYSD